MTESASRHLEPVSDWRACLLLTSEQPLHCVGLDKNLTQISFFQSCEPLFDAQNLLACHINNSSLQIFVRRCQNDLSFQGRTKREAVTLSFLQVPNFIVW